ncbi:unnamed protein product [Citrullus colocynthis]|uniref:RING-type E3 ubiquitin transferase n=1 Tax=Citrullus colocynthis TaxID=252529 RepID=A0ABP0XUW9_9ROSI
MVMEIVVSAVLLVVGIAVLVVIHVCIVGRALRGEGEGIWRSNSNGNSNYGMKRFSKEDLEKLPCYEYKTRDLEMECVVCLENFKNGERCRLLPNCNHSFHVQCIDSWLLNRPICPICRTFAAARPKISLIQLN